MDPSQLGLDAPPDWGRGQDRHIPNLHPPTAQGRGELDSVNLTNSMGVV